MGQLKVLHVHDSDLDDPRIITSAITGKKAGYELHFCGVESGARISENIFASYHWYQINHQAQVAKRMRHLAPLWELAGNIHPKIKKYGYPFPHYGAWVEKQIAKVVDEVKPDIIHAHNIIAAHYCDYFGIPMVVDDHEYLSLHTKALDEDVTMKKSLSYRIASKRWYEWEQELGAKYPVVTVSDPIAEYWRQRSKHVYTIPNYPLKDMIQLEGFRYAKDVDSVVSVYLGTDDNVNRVKSIRNIFGLHDVFNGNGTGKLLRIGVPDPNTDHINSVGRLRLEEGWNYMKTRGHIGLLPWKKHWFHKYCSPNKLAEYAHCGLWVMMTSDMTFAISEFAGHCDTFEDYDDMRSKIEQHNHHREELDQKRLQLLEWAKSHLIWERYEDRLLEAYKVA